MSRGKSESVPLSKAQNVSRTLWRVWFSVADFLSSWHPAVTVHRWCFAFRSFRAHIRIQRATGGSVDLGTALVLRDGCYQPNERTDARAEGIEKLRATHPWAGLPHFQTFLEGFDAGERYGIAFCRDQSNPDRSQTQTEQQEPSQPNLSRQVNIVECRNEQSCMECVEMQTIPDVRQEARQLLELVEAHLERLALIRELEIQAQDPRWQLPQPTSISSRGQSRDSVVVHQQLD